MSAEVQEFDGTSWIVKSRVESRYDPATGLPTRTIARKDLTAPVTDECAATLTVRSGDLVTDFYYDNRGNLALKKVYGGDDAQVFRSYSGTGNKPAPSTAPGTPATVPPNAN